MVEISGVSKDDYLQDSEAGEDKHRADLAIPGGEDMDAPPWDPRTGLVWRDPAVVEEDTDSYRREQEVSAVIVASSNHLDLGRPVVDIEAAARP